MEYWPVLFVRLFLFNIALNEHPIAIHKSVKTNRKTFSELKRYETNQ